jgi:inosine-uridine nucleoside N-ribohydrolase
MKNIILDCDPGHDDMIAIILACASSKINLLGITTVAGNQKGDKTLNNALKTLTLIGETHIPVARGFNKPLFRELTVAPHIHGDSGLDGADLPEPGIEPSELGAVDFIVHTLQNEPKNCFIVATGPLTNIAMVLFKNPELTKKIERIVIMGGALFDSNITPSAEFNIYVDPEAAKIVLDSGLPITMVTLDVSNKALFTPRDIEKIECMGGNISKIVGGLLHFFYRTNMDTFGFRGAPLHDPITVAYTIDPGILETKPLSVDVETRGELTRGRTVADVYGITGKKPNVEVSFKLDLDRYKKLVFDAVKKYSIKA